MMKTREEIRKAIKEAEYFLQKNDPVLGKIISRIGPCTLGARENYFEALVRSVIGQQLSVKVAARIYEKLLSALEYELSPERVSLLSEEETKAFGLSKQKGSYIKNIAAAFLNKDAFFENVNSLPDEEVLPELTKIKGVGLWTAQIFLIFSLNRLDILPLGDAGLRRSVALHYQIDKPTDLEVATLSEKWAPFRSIAVWYLWKGLDT